MSVNQQHIPPGLTLGVMGGGQLGRMFSHAAQQAGYAVAVLDPDEHSPAGLVSHHHIKTGYADDVGLTALVGCSAAVTTEFENVPAQALATLAKHVPVSPSAQAVAVCQDRSLEKAHFVACGADCAPYALIENADQLAQVPEALLPGILKTARLGYDGKGQKRVNTREELVLAWHALGEVACLLEKMLPLQYEVSVILARSQDGQVVHLPLQQNLHRDGILAVTQVPAPDVSPAVATQAFDWASRIAQGLAYVGVLCVEFFVLTDGRLVVNEMAPRPHNSGHYSLDACDVSQFDLQVRAMTGTPLVMPHQHSAAVMLNVLGDLWFTAGDQPVTPPWAQVLAIPGVKVHLYGKAEARRGRKMGHINVLGRDLAQARSRADEVAVLLGLPKL